MKSTFLHFRIVFLVIGVIVTASAYMTVFGATFPSYSADALERFHREQNRQIFELLPIQQDVLGDLFASESKINHFERIYDRVDASIDQTLEQKMMATNAKHSLENSITQSKKHLQSWEELKKKSQKEIAQINEELLKIANNIESLGEEIEKNKKQIKQYIVKTYTNNQGLFIDEQKHVNVLHTLFQNTDNIASGIIQQNNSKILSHVGHAMLAKNKDYLHSQSEMRKNMSELKEKKLMHKFRIKELTKNTEISLAYQEKLNKIAKKKQSILNENHLKNKKLESDILIEVQALREEYDQKIHTIRELNNCEQSDNDMCHYVDMYYFAEKKLRDQYLGRDEASFRWPVDISRGFSATFRDRDYFQTLGATHYGVDVRVPQGSDIIAPEDGYVLYLNPPTPYNYSYLALKHPDGYVTVYGHLSETFVSRFEFVQAGDIIAKSGGALGTPGAGSITSGPHLHFEMYHEKKSVDPMRHISIAELPKEHIPKKYRYKYYLDLKENKPKTNPRSLKKSIHLLHFKGENELQRQQNFLKKYAASSFGVWDYWVKSAISGNIDPSFIMCIGFAESGLGTNLTTGYNVGNVGNTDSGARKQFESPIEGIQQIVWTLNGRFLGNHTKLSQLSGWGNPSGTIYASSQKHWHENIINCMSALKNKFVEDDFEFRISNTEKQIYADELWRRKG